MSEQPSPFTCNRCGYTSPYRESLLRHLKRKTPCPPVHSQTPLIELADSFRQRQQRSFNKSSGTYDCIYCGKKYQSSAGKYKHQTKCHRAMGGGPSGGEVASTAVASEVETRIQLQEERYKQLEDMYKNLLQHMTRQNITNINVNDVIINNHLVVNIRPFGQENTEYLFNDENLLKHILSSKGPFLQKLVQAVHFNENHPENMNVYISNLRGKHAIVYDGIQFSVKLKDETIDKVIKTKQVLIEGNIDGLGLDDDTILAIQEKLYMLRSNQEVMDSLKQKVELICYNGREQVIQMHQLASPPRGDALPTPSSADIIEL